MCPESLRGSVHDVRGAPGRILATGRVSQKNHIYFSSLEHWNLGYRPVTNELELELLIL
jgi:hypothetical protein